MSWYSEARERNHRALELLGEAAGLLRQNAATMTDLGLSRHTHDAVEEYSRIAEQIDFCGVWLTDQDIAEQEHWRKRGCGDADVLSIARSFTEKSA